MKHSLKGKKVAVLVTHGFEESEFTKPIEALKEAEAEVQVISLKSGTVKSWTKGNWGNEFPVDKTIEEADCLRLVVK